MQKRAPLEDCRIRTPGNSPLSMTKWVGAYVLQFHHFLSKKTLKQLPHHLPDTPSQTEPLLPTVITHSLCVSRSAVSNSLWPHGPYSPPGSSVHGILQARIPEWVAISFSRGSSQPSDWTRVSSITGKFFTIWAKYWLLSFTGIAWHKYLNLRYFSRVPCNKHPMFPLSEWPEHQCY